MIPEVVGPIVERREGDCALRLPPSTTSVPRLPCGARRGRSRLPDAPAACLPGPVQKQALLHLRPAGGGCRRLGEQIVNQLVAAGIVKTPADLYDAARQCQETLAGLERMGEKSAINLVRAIDRSRDTTLARFHFCAWHPQCRRDHRQDLAPFRRSRCAPRRRRGGFAEVPDVGPVVARCIVDFLAEDPTTGSVIAVLKQGACAGRKPKAAQLGGRPWPARLWF